MSKPTAVSYFKEQLWHSNQILVAILGICSALGITNRLSVAITMGVSVSLVTACSSFFVSLLRNVTPDSVRMITQLAIISVFVTIIDQFMKAYMFPLSKVMSVFVGLIITNCIVMGRAESMAKNIEPIPAFMDGLGAGAGYMLVICAVGVIREVFGFGQLLGYQVIPQSWYATPDAPFGYENFSLMVSPPAAFFIIGGFIWLYNIASGEKHS
ncbi:putative Na(+)-translocating NADH-quinone reductase subunit D [Waddlia chondrophila 2032/99]|uniref:Na(+)-translocating NADH-quinone reductase subunit D n=2 Tax=Waddlia chondrophila TaxID=71667 RepID=D6YU32_WADCW|nr:NADH:ubiquinone reductase (Na(+)-transporting) subunit D [Waddlia chondrophila]ADI37643.1 Na(+)-translocating NADH-quinone reductase subunit D [Waddlia chondrophila WSU 86-1044]CCB90610.1 putative Na(+)-translocating NADH-quinone reductase subunit D [Waddlia chondrophila 2032/99]